MTIRAIFFDAGDTLVYKWCLKSERFAFLCEAAGVPLPADPALRAAGAVANERFFQDRRKHADAWSEPWHCRLNLAGLEAMGIEGDLNALALQIYKTSRELPESGVIDPDALPLLERLRSQGYKLAIVSNWDGSLVDRLRPTKLSGYFDAILDSSVVGSAKPEAKIFEIACAVTGVRPEEAIHVGDSPGADVAGAFAAGVNPVLLDQLGIFSDGFAGLPSFPSIRRLGELEQVLAGWGE